MIWSACTCTIRVRASCPMRACSRSKTPKGASCSKSIGAAPPWGRAPPPPARNGSPNWTAPCAGRAWIRCASARANPSRRRCNDFLRPAAEGGGDERMAAQPHGSILASGSGYDCSVAPGTWCASAFILGDARLGGFVGAYCSVSRRSWLALVVSAPQRGGGPLARRDRPRRAGRFAEPRGRRGGGQRGFHCFSALRHCRTWPAARRVDLSRNPGGAVLESRRRCRIGRAHHWVFAAVR